eukprot:354136_1
MGTSVLTNGSRDSSSNRCEARPSRVLNAVLDRADSLRCAVEEFSTIHKIPGVSKLRRNVLKERKFFSTLHSCPEETIASRIRTSNLPFLEALYETLSAEHGVISVLSRFDSCSVDIVSEKGRKWIKMKAQSPWMIQQVYDGMSSRKNKNLVGMASRYVSASREHLIDYEPPKVVFVFANGVTESVADALRAVGAMVRGQIFSDFVGPDGSEGGDMKQLSCEDLEYFDESCEASRGEEKTTCHRLLNLRISEQNTSAKWQRPSLRRQHCLF